MKGMSAEDKKWQAENDARTMKESAMIQADEKRHKAAMEVMMKEKEAMEKMMSMEDMEKGAKKRFSKTYKEA